MKNVKIKKIKILLKFNKMKIKSSKKTYLGLLFLVPILFLINFSQIHNIFYLNIFSINILKNVMAQDIRNIVTGFEVENKNMTNYDCHILWLKSIYLKKITQLSINSNNSNFLLHCSPLNAHLIINIETNNEEIIDNAIDLYPSISIFLYSKLSKLNKDNYLEIINLYKKIVENYPNDSYAWSRLGKIYEGLKDLDSALLAYKEACVRGDVGAHGCYNAGRILEIKGDYLLSANFYSRSRWVVSRNKANSLINRIKSDSQEK